MSKPFFKLRPLSSLGLRRFYGAAAGALVPGLALAGPTGGAVVGGQATIGAPTAGGTVITQTSQNAVINWQEFSVGGNEFVLFNQPNASAAVLNRVVGGLPSEILGDISANGRVFIVNPQGVMFGAGSRVDVNGLVASTLNIKDQDFMSGRHVFAQGSAAPGTVRNEGRISAGPNGFVVLAGDRVENAGIITANRGEVLLASGSKMTLTLDAEGLVGYSIDAAALSDRAGVENLGEIVANGGTVVLDAKVARSLMGNVINNRGKITARSVEERDGAIYLLADGGNIENSGTLDASGTGNADGGRVIVHGQQDVTLTETGVIRADGAGTGNGGMVRFIAEGDARTAEGSLISATAGPAGRLGGFVELSGHGSLVVRGTVNVGRGGRILIDPSNVTIAAGAGASGSTVSGFNATVYENFIEGQLQAGADVAIVATNSINMNAMTGASLDGRNAGNGGSLLLGIGTIAGSSTGKFVDGPPASGSIFTNFNPTGGGSYGGIFFQNLGNAIRVDGRLRISGGTAFGDTNVGDLEAGDDLDVTGAHDITVGNVTAGGAVVISNTFGSSGAIDTGTVTASDITVSGVAGIDLGAVTLTGTGGSVSISNSSGTSTDINFTTITAANAAAVDIDASRNIGGTSIDAGTAIVTLRSGLNASSGGINVATITGEDVHLSAFNSSISGTQITAGGGFGVGGDISITTTGVGSVTLSGLTLLSDGRAEIDAANVVNLRGGSYDVGTGGMLDVTSNSTTNLGNPFSLNTVTVDGSLKISAATVNGSVGSFAGPGTVLSVGGSLEIDAGTQVNFAGAYGGAIFAGGVADINVGSGTINVLSVRGDRVILTTKGDINATGVSAGGGGTGPGITVADVYIDAGITANVGGVALDSSGYVFLGGSSVTNTAAGSFNVGAGGTLHVRTGGISLASSNYVGNLVVEANNISGGAVDASGNMTLDASGSVNLVGISAGGTVTVSAGISSSSSIGISSIILGFASADRVLLTNENGSISVNTIQAGGGGIPSTPDVQLSAQRSGATIAIDTLNLASDGQAYFFANDGFTNTDLSTYNVGSASGTLSLVTNADLNIGTQNFTGNLNITADDLSGGTLTATGDMFMQSRATMNFTQLSAGADLLVIGDNISVGSAVTIGMATGDTVEILSGTINVGSILARGVAGAGNDVHVSSFSNIDINGLTVTEAGGGRVLIEGLGGTTRVELQGAADVGTAGTIDITTQGGDIFFQGSSSSAAFSLVGNLTGTTSGLGIGDIDITTGMTINGDLSLMARGAVSVVGGISGSGNVTLGGGLAGPPGGVTVDDISVDRIDIIAFNGGVTVTGTLSTAGTGTSADRDIDVQAAGVTNVAAIDLVGAGFVSLSGNGGITLPPGSYDVGGGTLSLSTQSTLNLGNFSLTGNLTANGNTGVTASAVSVTGSLGLSAGNGNVMVSGAVSAGTTGGALADIAAGFGRTVSLGSVTADRIEVTAGGGITIGALTAGGGGNSGSRDISLLAFDTGATVSAGDILATPNGYVTLQGHGGVTLTGDADVGLGGTLKLTTNNGDIAVGTVTQGGNLIATASNGGNITASGDITGRKVTLNAAAFSGNGGISINGVSATGGTAGGIDIDAHGTGAIFIDGALTLGGAVGTIDIFGQGNVTLDGDANAGAGGTITVRSTGGFLHIGSSGTSSAVNLVGDLTAFADNGGSLSAWIASGDNVNLQLRSNGGPAADILLGDVSVFGNLTVNNASGGGAGNNVVIAGIVDAGDEVSINSLNDVEVQAAGSLNADGMDGVGIAAGNNVLVDGTISATAGQVNIQAVGDIVGAAAITAAGVVELFAGNSAGAVGNLNLGNLSGSRVRLYANGDISTGTINAAGGFDPSGSGDVEIDTDSSGTGRILQLGDITLAADGSVNIFAAGGANLTNDIDAGNPGGIGTIDIVVRGGSLSLGTSGAAINLTGNLSAAADSGAALSANIGGGSDVNLQIRTFGGPAADMTIDGINVSGDVLLSNASGGGLGGSNIVINGVAHADGNIAVRSLGDLDVRGGGQLDADGNIAVDVNNDILTGGAVRAGANVRLGALDNILGAATITAGNNLELFAGSSGGTSGPVNPGSIAVGNLDAAYVRVVGYGDVSVGTINAQALGAASGDVDIDAFGTGAVTSLGAITLTGGSGSVQILGNAGVTLLNGIDTGGSTGAIGVLARGGTLALGAVGSAITLRGNVTADADSGAAMFANFTGANDVNLQLRSFGGPAADLTVGGLNVSGNVLLSNASGGGVGGSDTRTIRVNGAVTAGGSIDIRPVRDVDISAAVDAGTDLKINAGGDVSATALLSANGLADIRGTGFVSLDSVDATSIVLLNSGNITVNGSLSAGGGGSNSGNANIFVRATGGNVSVAGINLLTPGYALLEGDAGVDVLAGSFNVGIGGTLDLRTNATLDFGTSAAASFTLDGNLLATAPDIVGNDITVGGDLDFSGGSTGGMTLGNVRAATIRLDSAGDVITGVLTADGGGSAGSIGLDIDVRGGMFTSVAGIDMALADGFARLYSPQQLVLAAADVGASGGLELNASIIALSDIVQGGALVVGQSVLSGNNVNVTSADFGASFSSVSVSLTSLTAAGAVNLFGTGSISAIDAGGAVRIVNSMLVSPMTLGSVEGSSIFISQTGDLTVTGGLTAAGGGNAGAPDITVYATNMSLAGISLLTDGYAYVDGGTVALDPAGSFNVGDTGTLELRASSGLSFGTSASALFNLTGNLTATAVSIAGNDITTSGVLSLTAGSGTSSDFIQVGDLRATRILLNHTSGPIFTGVLTADGGGSAGSAGRDIDVRAFRDVSIAGIEMASADGFAYVQGGVGGGTVVIDDADVGASGGLEVGGGGVTLNHVTQGGTLLVTTGATGGDITAATVDIGNSSAGLISFNSITANSVTLHASTTLSVNLIDATGMVDLRADGGFGSTSTLGDVNGSRIWFTGSHDLTVTGKLTANGGGTSVANPDVMLTTAGIVTVNGIELLTDGYAYLRGQYGISFNNGADYNVGSTGTLHLEVDGLSSASLNFGTGTFTLTGNLIGGTSGVQSISGDAMDVSGDLVLAAADDISFTGLVSAGGDIDLSAGMDLTGALTLSGGVSAAGGVLLDAYGQTLVGIIGAAGDVNVLNLAEDGTDVSVGAINASGNVDLMANEGNVTTAGITAGGYVDIRARDDSGIDPVDSGNITIGGTVSAGNNPGAIDHGVRLNAFHDVLAQDFSVAYGGALIGGNSYSMDGTFRAGNIDAGSVLVTTGGDFDLTGGAITRSDDFQVTAGGALTANPAAVIDAATQISLVGGSIDVGGLTATTGIQLTANDGIRVRGLADAGSNLSLDNLGENGTDIQFLELRAGGNVNVTAEEGNIIGDGNGLASDAAITAGGSVALTARNDLGGSSLDAGNITLSGNVTSGTSAGAADHDLQMFAQNSISAQDLIVQNGGLVDADAVAGDFAVDNVSGSTVTIDAGGDFTADPAGSITSVGSLAITAGGAMSFGNLSAGSFALEGGSVDLTGRTLNATGGDLSILSRGDILADGAMLSATDRVILEAGYISGNGDISLVGATLGAGLDSLGDNVDLRAQGGTLTLDTATLSGGGQLVANGDVVNLVNGTTATFDNGIFSDIGSTLTLSNSTLTVNGSFGTGFTFLSGGTATVSGMTFIGGTGTQITADGSGATVLSVTGSSFDGTLSLTADNGGILAGSTSATDILILGGDGVDVAGQTLTATVGSIAIYSSTDISANGVTLTAEDKVVLEAGYNGGSGSIGLTGATLTAGTDSPADDVDLRAQGGTLRLDNADLSGAGKLVFNGSVVNLVNGTTASFGDIITSDATTSLTLGNSTLTGAGGFLLTSQGTATVSAMDFNGGSGTQITANGSGGTVLTVMGSTFDGTLSLTADNGGILARNLTATDLLLDSGVEVDVSGQPLTATAGNVRIYSDIDILANNATLTATGDVTLESGSGGGSGNISLTGSTIAADTDATGDNVDLRAMGGTLAVDNSDLSGGGALIFNGDAVSFVNGSTANFGGQITSDAVNSLTMSSSTLDGAGGFFFNVGNTVAISGVDFSGGGASQITVNGMAPTDELSVTNSTFDGTLSLTADNARIEAGALTAAALTFNGAVVDINNNSLTATAGGISITSDTDVLAASSTLMATEDVSLTASTGNIDLSSATVTVSGGSPVATIALSAAGTVDLSNASLSAPGDFIASLDNLILTGASLDFGGNLSLTDNSGDFDLSGLSLSGGTLTLTANGGSIVGPALLLESTSGGVFLFALQDVNLPGQVINAADGLEIKAGKDFLSSGPSGSISMAGSTLDAGSGHLQIYALGGAFSGGALTTTGFATILASGGDVTLDSLSADSGIDLDASGKLTVGGTIDSVAGQFSIDVGTGVDVNGNITGAGNAFDTIDIHTLTGTIDLLAVTATGGSIRIGNQSGEAATNITFLAPVSAVNGSVDIRGTGDVKMPILTAGTGVFIQAGTALEVLAAVDAGTGNVTLQTTAGHLTVGDVTTTAFADINVIGGDILLSGLSADGGIDLDGSGRLTVNGTIDSVSGQFSIDVGTGVDVNGNISGAGNAFDVIDIHSLSGTIDLQTVTATGGSIRIGNQSGELATNVTLTGAASAINGSVDIRGAGLVNLPSVNAGSDIFLEAGTGLDVLTSVSAGNNLTLRTTSGNLTAGTVTAVAFADIDAGGNVTFDSLSADTGIDLDAGGSLTVNGAIDSIAGQFSLDAGTGVAVNGNITGAGNAFDVIDIHSAGGSIDLQSVTATDGSIRIGNQFGGGATDVTLAGAASALNGSVDIRGNGLVNLPSVTAGGDVFLQAGIDLDVLTSVSAGNNLTLRTTSGNLTAGTVTAVAFADIDAGGNVTFDSLSADTGIDLDAGGSLTVNGAVDSIAGQLSLDAGTGIHVSGNITGAGNSFDIIEVHTAAGTIDLQSVTATDGSIRIGNQSGEAATDITLAGAASAVGGFVDIRGDGVVSLPGVNAGGDVFLQAGSTLDVLTSVSAGNNLTLRTTTGDLTMNTVTAAGTAVIDVGGNVTLASLSADAGIDLDAGGSLTVNGAIDSVTGQLSLDVGTGVDVNGDVTGAGNAFDTIEIHTLAGAIDLQSVTATGGNIRIGNQSGQAATGVTALDLSAAGGFVDVLADNVDVQAVTGDMGIRLWAQNGTLLAGGDLTANNGYVDLYASNGSLSLTQVIAGGGNAALRTAAGGLTVTGVVSASGLADIDVVGGDIQLGSLSGDAGIDLDGSGSLTVNGGIDSIAGQFNIDVGTGVLVSGHVNGAGNVGDVIEIHTLAGAIDLQTVSAGDGSIRIGNQSGQAATSVTTLDLFTVTGFIDVLADSASVGTVNSGGNIRLWAQNGTLLVSSDVTANNGGVDLLAGSGPLLLSAVTAGGGGATLRTAAGGLTVLNALSATGGVDIDVVGGDVTLGSLRGDAGIDLDASGKLTVLGDISNVSGGFTIDAGTGIEVQGDISGAGNSFDLIDLHTAGGDISLRNVTATAGSMRIGNQFGGQAADNITTLNLSAVTGSVDVVGNGNVSVQQVTADTGIRLHALGGTLDVAGNLQTDNNGIDVYASTGLLVLADVTTGNGGGITIGTGNGGLMAGDISASGGTTINVVGGDIQLDSLRGDAGIDLDASGKLTVLGAINNINGGFTIDAGTGIEVQGDISGAGNSFDIIDLHTTGGDILLQNVTATAGSMRIGNQFGGQAADNITTLNLSAVTGSVDVVGNGNASVQQLTADTGIRLHALGGTLGVVGDLQTDNNGIDVYAGAGLLSLGDVTTGNSGGITIGTGSGGLIAGDISASGGVVIDVVGGDVTLGSLRGDAGIDLDASGKLMVLGAINNINGGFTIDAGTGIEVQGDISGAGNSFDLIDLHTAGGDISLRNVTATAGSMRIGNQFGGQAADNITTLNLSAVTGSVDVVGNGNVSVQQVTADTGIRLHAVGGTLDVGSDLQTDNNGIDVYAGTGLLVLTDVTAGNGGVTIGTGNGSLLAGDISASGGVVINVIGGDIDLDSLSGDAGIDVTGSGKLTVLGAITNINGGFEIDVGTGIEVQGDISGAGNSFDVIDLHTASGDILLQNVTATAGSMRIGNQFGGLAADNITALDLSAATGSINVAGNGTVSLGSATAGGNLFITSTAGDVDLDGPVSGSIVNISAIKLLSATLLDVTSTAGDINIFANVLAPVIDLDAAGNLFISGAVDAGPTGTVILAANNGTVTTGAITSDDLDVTARAINFGDLLVAGDLALTSTAGDIFTGTLTASTVTLDSAADIDIGAVSASGAVDLQANNIVLRGTVDGGSVAVTANDVSGVVDIGASAGTIDVNAATVRSTLIDLSGHGGVIVSGQLDAGASGSVILTSSNGLLQVNGGITAGSAQATAVSLDVADIFGVSGASLTGDLLLTATGGDLVAGDLQAGTRLELTASNRVDSGNLTSTGGSILVNGAVIDVGNVDAAGDVTATASTGTLDAGTIDAGNVTLSATAAPLTAGAIVANGAVTVDAHSITLAGVQADSAALSAAYTLSLVGDIDVTGLADLNGNTVSTAKIGAGTLILNASGTVDTGDLDTTVGGITIDGTDIDVGIVTAAGDVQAVAASGDLTLDSVDGNAVTLRALGGTVDTGAVTGAGAVILDANAILLGGAVQGSSVNAYSGTTMIASGSLTVTATGGTLDLAAASISGNGATLSATGAMNVVGDLDGGSGLVSVNGGGSVGLTKVGAGTLALSSGTTMTTGDLDATVGGITIDGTDIDVGIVTAAGDIDATALNGNLQITQVSSAHAVTLVANSGTLDVGAITGTGAVELDANAILLGGAVQGNGVDAYSGTTMVASGILVVNATAGALRLEALNGIQGNGADLDAGTTLTLASDLDAGSGLADLNGAAVSTAKIGAGQLILTSTTSVQTGDVTVGIGGLSIGGTSATLGALTATAGGDATVTITGGNLTINGLTRADAVTLKATGGTLDVDGITGTGAVDLDAQAILLGGAVQGSSVNAHAGNTMVASGILMVNATGGDLDLQATTISGNGADLSAGGALRLAGELQGGSGLVDLSGASVSTNKVGAGTLIIGGTASVNTGDLQATVGTITVNGGSIGVQNVNAAGGFTATASGGNLATGTIDAGGASLTASGTLSTGRVTSTGAVIGNANQILLGGAVSGTMVNLSSATTLTASGLLDVSATSGLLRLQGSTVSGNGVDLSATAALTVVGSLGGGASLVKLDGDSILADDINGGRVELNAVGLIATDNVGSGAGGMLITGGGIATGNLLATAGGDITGAARAGDLTAGTVNGDVVVLTASGRIDTGTITANQLGLTAGGQILATSLQVASGGAVVEGGSIFLGGIVVAGGDLDATATSGDLETGNISANVVDLTSDHGDIEAGNVVATEASFSAPEGAITVGTVDAQGDVDFDSGTDIEAGTLTVAGTLFADLFNTDAVFGNVNAQAVDLSVIGGDIIIGNVVVQQDIDLEADGSVQFGNLSGRDITIGMGADSTIGSSVVNASGSFSLSGGGTLNGNTLTVNAQSIDLQTAITLDTLTLDADTSLTLGQQVFNVEHLVADAQTILLDGSTLHGADADLDATGGLTLTAADLVVDDITLSAGGALVVTSTRLQGDLDADAGGAASFSSATLLGGSGQVNGDHVIVQNSNVSYGSGFGLVASGGDVDVVASSIVSGGSLGFQAQGGQVGISQSSLQSGGAASLTASGDIDVTSSSVIAGSNLAFQSQADIGISDSSLQANGVATVVTLGNIGLTNSDFSGGRYTIQAGGTVQDAGEGGSLFDVAALGISAGSSIELGNSAFQVGNGLAAIGGDSGLLQALGNSADADLLPQSTGPNASFIANRVVLGSLDLTGDYLFISSNEVVLNGSIEAPLDLFVHYSPLTTDADLGIEVAASLARQINLNRDEHFNVFPGTTFAIGGAGYSGDIYIGENGSVSLDTHESNFVFMTQGNIFGLSSLGTNGAVVVLDGLVDTSSGEFEMPLNSEFLPDLPDDDLEMRDPEDDGVEFGAGEIEYETAPEIDEELQCS